MTVHYCGAADSTVATKDWGQCPLFRHYASATTKSKDKPQNRLSCLHHSFEIKEYEKHTLDLALWLTLPARMCVHVYACACVHAFMRLESSSEGYLFDSGL